MAVIGVTATVVPAAVAGLTADTTYILQNQGEVSVYIDTGNSVPADTYSQASAGTAAIDLAAGYMIGDAVLHVDTVAGAAMTPGQHFRIAGDNTNYRVLKGEVAIGEEGDISIAPALTMDVADDAVITFYDFETAAGIEIPPRRSHGDGLTLHSVKPTASESVYVWTSAGSAKVRLAEAIS